ncbi:hypothetical protein HAX54_010094, partial [Datura stramonium]|nr:hypothetical protein [Datura stramonium]
IRNFGIIEDVEDISSLIIAKNWHNSKLQRFIAKTLETVITNIAMRKEEDNRINLGGWLLKSWYFRLSYIPGTTKQAKQHSVEENLHHGWKLEKLSTMNAKVEPLNNCNLSKMMRHTKAPDYM